MIILFTDNFVLISAKRGKGAVDLDYKMSGLEHLYYEREVLFLLYLIHFKLQFL